MNKLDFLKTIPQLAGSYAVHSVLQRFVPREDGEMPTPLRLASVSLSSIVMEFGDAYIERYVNDRLG